MRMYHCHSYLCQMDVLGLMSGSSLDGLDVALCSIDRDSLGQFNCQLLFGDTVVFDASLRDRLGCATQLGVQELLKLEVDFSKFCAQVVREIKSKQNRSIDYICSHGHTIYHCPEDGYTLQVGKGSIIAEMTGIPCIVDVRANDLAQGGQGAPVAAIVEHYLYPGYSHYLNLGGIANISHHNGLNIASWDSCPCNQVLNHIAHDIDLPYDDNGLLARDGHPHMDLVEEWRQLTYFSQPAPKSLDNSWIRDRFITIMNQYQLSHLDRLASMVEFIAHQIFIDCTELARSQVLPSKMMVTGGGVFNSYLVERIQHYLNQLRLQLVIPDQQTIQYKEAILMALMGYLRVNGISNTIARATGAQRDTIGGAIYTCPRKTKSITDGNF